MPPKNPVRIGLIKQRPAPTDDDLVDEFDNDNTVPPLSTSVMEALEEIVSEDASEDLFAEEIDRDRDPDYVQPQDAEQPGPSRLRGKKQPALNLVTTATGTASSVNSKGRSNAPIWKYFDISDKNVNGRIEKGAVCKVEVSGIPCGKRIMQNLSSTTGLNQHLERRHPAAFEEWKTLQINLQAEKMSTKRTLNDRFDDLEGVKLINIYFIIVAFEKIIVYIAIHEKIIVLKRWRSRNLSFDIVFIIFYLLLQVPHPKSRDQMNQALALALQVQLSKLFPRHHGTVF